ncbi:MAG: N-acetyltransferase [Chloroflexota bacterium]
MISLQLPETLFSPQTAVFPLITFRPIQHQDKKAVHQACFFERPFLPFTDHFNHMLQWQAKGRCCWIIACEQADGIVGSGQLICYPHSSELANLAVVSAYQGQGIGTALIEILTAVAAHAHIPHLEISVHSDNQRAKKLYERLGFELDRQIGMPPAFVLRRKI